MASTSTLTERIEDVRGRHTALETALARLKAGAGYVLDVVLVVD